jgi:ribulose 1,5-bisphosphate synthetase/thiazole synthase
MFATVTLHYKKNGMDLHDCIIVGGGPAGLNAAVVLGRCRRKVLYLIRSNIATGTRMACIIISQETILILLTF